MKVIGKPRRRVDGRAKVTGLTRFADDIVLPRMLHMKLLRSPHAHALIKEIRTQIGKGADVIKLYADYRWGLNKDAQPTFTLDELKKAVEVTKSSGRKLVTHAVTAEAMRRAALAGVSSIEHGDKGTEEVFQLMKEKGVALCPTLSAGESILQYDGW